MNVDDFTEQEAHDLVNNSKWAKRYFKSLPDLKSQFTVIAGSEWYHSIPRSPSGQTRLLYLHMFRVEDKPLLFTKSFDPGYYEHGIKTYLGAFGLGDTHQKAWDDSFCEEMFMPVEWKPEAASPSFNNGWYAGYNPPIPNTYVVKRTIDSPEEYLDWGNDHKWKNKNGSIINVARWKFRDSHEWNLGSQPPKSTGILYHVSVDGEVFKSLFTEYSHPGGTGKEMCGPDFIDENTGYGMEVDWWRECPVGSLDIDKLNEKAKKATDTTKSAQLMDENNWFNLNRVKPPTTGTTYLIRDDNGDEYQVYFSISELFYDEEENLIENIVSWKFIGAHWNHFDVISPTEDGTYYILRNGSRKRVEWLSHFDKYYFITKISGKQTIYKSKWWKTFKSDTSPKTINELSKSLDLAFPKDKTTVILPGLPEPKMSEKDLNYYYLTT